MIPISHFTVLVIGDNVEEQLEPYNENTEVERYAEVEAETVDDFWYTKQLREKGKIGENPTMEGLLKALKEEWGEDEVDSYFVKDGKLMRWSTHNPDSKWDWWVIGGRWSGFFQLKKGATGLPPKDHWGETLNGGVPSDKSGKTDQALKSAIDFDFMREEAQLEAALEFQGLKERTQGIDPPEKPWKEIYDSLGISDSYPEDYASWDEEKKRAWVEEKRATVAKAREAYNNHPWVKAAQNGEFMWDDPYEVYKMDAEDPEVAYIKACRDRVTTPYAVVKDGQWYGKGDMGWWGMSSNDIDQDEWNTRVAEMIDDLPEDTLLTLVDAHV